MEEASRKREHLSRAEAQLTGWLALGALTVVVANAKLGVPARVGDRLVQAAFDLGHALALGLLSASAVGLFARWGPRLRHAPTFALALAAIAVGELVLREDFTGVAGASGALPFLVAAAASLIIPATALVGHRLAAKNALLPAALGLGLGAYHAFIFERAYPGLHLFASWMAALLLAAGLTRAPRPRLPPGLARVAPGVLSLCAAAALVVEVPARVLIEMYRVPSSSLAPFLAKLRDRSPVGRVDGAWFQDRRGLPPTPPTEPPLHERPPIVLLLTVDAIRADLLSDEKYRAALPTLFRMRDEGVWFTQARAPSPATVPSLSAIFTGRFYSQLYWSEQTGGGRQKLYPHEDPTPRFQALLGEAGADTVLVMSGTGFLPKYGMTTDFRETLDKGSPVGLPAKTLTDHILARLASQRDSDQPMFVYTHYFEPHAPYDRAGKQGSPFERYLREVAIVDGELARIREQLEQAGMAERTLLIVTGDHGEAFGEHGTHDHAVSLYDELTHVPLVFWGARLGAGRVDQLVSLADLGPTILDLNRLPTPSSFLGQSLVPLLRGDDVVLERPVVSESGRHVEAMYFPDGYKLIVDRRLGTRELYHLPTDPKELRELSATEPEVFSQRLAALRAYFDAHAFRKEGYRLPYRP